MMPLKSVYLTIQKTGMPYYNKPVSITDFEPRNFGPNMDIKVCHTLQVFFILKLVQDVKWKN